MLNEHTDVKLWPFQYSNVSRDMISIMLKLFDVWKYENPMKTVVDEGTEFMRLASNGVKNFWLLGGIFVFLGPEKQRMWE